MEFNSGSQFLPEMPLAFSYPVIGNDIESPGLMESEDKMEGEEGLSVNPELEILGSSMESSRETSQDIIVHTNVGHALMVATLWLCLNFSSKGSSSGGSIFIVSG